MAGVDCRSKTSILWMDKIMRLLGWMKPYADRYKPPGHGRPFTLHQQIDVTLQISLPEKILDMKCRKGSRRFLRQEFFVCTPAEIRKPNAQAQSKQPTISTTAIIEKAGLKALSASQEMPVSRLNQIVCVTWTFWCPIIGFHWHSRLGCVVLPHPNETCLPG